MQRSYIVTILLATLFFIVCGAYIRFTLWPGREVEIPISMHGATIRIQFWAHLFDDADEVLVVETPHGSLRADLGIDWGVRPKMLFYKVSEDKIGILRDGSTFEAAINLSSKEGPSYENITGDTGNDWIYLGTFAGKFFKPDEMKECYAMFGAARAKSERLIKISVIARGRRGRISPSPPKAAMGRSPFRTPDIGH